MTIPRRVVTGLRGGKAVILSDDSPPNTHLYEHCPGFMTSVCWATVPAPSLPLDGSEAAPPIMRITPAPGETRLLIVRFPPDSVFFDPRFNGVGFAAEQMSYLSGLAERFEVEDPAMHQTDSIDYDIVLDGEIWLELDDGVETHLRQGDVVIQGGVRHAWRNRSDRTATMSFVMIGAKTAD